MFDLKITGGTIVDGTGEPRYRGEVAIKDGVIVAVSDKVEGEAQETLDASGHLVTPGFVDIHTHYDGQATWDTLLDPSASHGVTTVVAGNCGVGFAPVRPGDVLNLKRTTLSKRVSNSRPEMGIIQFKWEVFDQTGELKSTTVGANLVKTRASVEGA